MTGHNAESVRVPDAYYERPEVVVATVLKRLYPQNPDVVLGREACTIVAALKESGFTIVRTATNA